MVLRANAIFLLSLLFSVISLFIYDAPSGKVRLLAALTGGKFAAGVRNTGHVQGDDLGFVCEYEALPHVHESEHFFINYNRLGRGLTVEDYANALEEAYTLQVETYGWAAPPLCGAEDRECPNENPWGKYPVQIYDLSADEGDWDGFVNAVGDYTGVVGDNPNSPARETASAATCMVINSYTQKPEGGTRREFVFGTAQHEFQHMIQFGYVGHGENKRGEQVIGDMWYESIATFFEEETNDEISYPTTLLWPDHTACLADYDRTGDPYANWLFFQYMVEQNGGAHSPDGGENMLQTFWERAVRSDDALSTFDAVLMEYDTTLDDAFHAYAAALSFSKACDGDSRTPYWFEEGAEYLAQTGALPDRDGALRRAAGEFRGTIREGYASNFVDLPVGRSYSVTLDNTARGGVLRASLLCYTGASLEVTAFPSEVPFGAESTLPYFDARACEQVTAALTSHTNNDACTARAYRLRLGAPAPDAEATPTPRPRATARATGIAGAATRVPSTRPTRTAPEQGATDAAPDLSPLNCLPAMVALLSLALWRRP